MSSLWGQTTGKISGTVKDVDTESPLPGANIIVEGTSKGAAADELGRFYIINLTPGRYNLRIDMIGFTPVILEDVLVSVNRTTPVDVLLSPAVLEGEVVVIEVDRLTMKKDQTGTIKNISSEEIESLPVETIDAVVGMQAGVVAGRFRGGRASEVSYMVDGVQVDEVYGGEHRTVTMEPEAIQDLEVITGTFNAEYGKAMSGVVNVVTKEGKEEYEGSFGVAIGGYYSGNDTVWVGNDELRGFRNQDYKFQLGGPLVGKTVSFFFNTRWEENGNHLNGIRRFLVDDFSIIDDNGNYFDTNRGDSAFVPLNDSKNFSAMGKLSFYLPFGIRSSLMYTREEDDWQDYNHGWKYNPDGLASSHGTTDFVVFSLNHMLNNNLFYEVKLSQSDNEYGRYLYENPTDTNYIHDVFAQTYPGFLTGGQDKAYETRTSTDRGAKIDLTWQVNPTHSLKAGFHYADHDILATNLVIRNRFEGDSADLFFYEPMVDFEDQNTDFIHADPMEYAAYLQDKMEFEEMVINFGLRYDYFDPNTAYPSDHMNPGNELPEHIAPQSEYPDAPVVTQWSPRFGLAYQLGSKANLHFSYGHFFQIPPYYALYLNPDFKVGFADLQVILGNALLKPEKTVTYEIGLRQEVIESLYLEVALFYRDIYNLLTAKAMSTYSAVEYGLMTNRDYGNVRGLEVKGDFVEGPFSVYVNYTLQYTRGAANNPFQHLYLSQEEASAAGILIPLDWDQRHTFNTTVGYKRDDYGISLVGYYNSGTPYTYHPITESALSDIALLPNNDYKPITYNFDVTAFYRFKVGGRYELKLDLSAYNLLDRLNAVSVYGSTGRPYTHIPENVDHYSDFNTINDRFQNPGMYSTPRYVKLGMSVSF